MNDKKEMDRRVFFGTLLRVTAISGLAIFAGLLGWKRNKALGDQTCINDSACGPCPNSGGCVLPQAKSYRKLKSQPKSKQMQRSS